MAQKTSIAWTDWTWSPVIGCSRTSPGCTHCYAERLVAVRMSRNPKLPMYHGLAWVRDSGEPQWSGEVRFLPERLAEPLSWRKPRKVFVCDMSDLFHVGVTNEQIAAVFGIMAATPHITYQILTKRAERLEQWFAWVEKRAEDGLRMFPDDPKEWRIRQMFRSYLGKLGIDIGKAPIHDGPWPLPNVWVGVTVEDRARKTRIDHLRRVPAAARFLSLEPLLEDLGELYLAGIDQAIIGGESGPSARPLNVTWARGIMSQCRASGTSIFVKQLGAHVVWDGVSLPGEHWPDKTAKTDTCLGHWRVHLRDRAGGDMSEFPEDLRVREFPEVTP